MRNVCFRNLLVRAPAQRLLTVRQTCYYAQPETSFFNGRSLTTVRTFARNQSNVPLPKEEDVDDVYTVPQEAAETEVAELSNVHPEILRNLKQNGVTKLFPVQSQTYNDSKSGLDLIVRSRTGSGKTLAFGLPLLETLLEEKKVSGRQRVGQPAAIVLAPTRELALQVHAELQKYCGSLNGAAVYGGSSYATQLQAIHDRRAPIDYVVGTPGRVCDLVTRGKLDVSQVKVAVLDEADEMLKIGFKDEIDDIFEAMPVAEERQNLLFSATFNKEVENIAKKYMKPGYKVINLVKASDEKIPTEIEMVSMVTEFQGRKDALANVLAQYCTGDKATRALVFANSKAMCDDLASCSEINKSGVNCVSLHGDMSQTLRENALRAFRQNKVKCVIATDVAARGLDIPEVDLVVHFGLPDKMESFVHRTGRTGRAGRNGVNIVLHDSRDADIMKDLERLTQRQFKRKPVPTRESMTMKKIPVLLENVQAKLNNDNHKVSTVFQEAAKKLLANGEGSQQVVSVLLQEMLGGDSNPREQISALTGRSGLVTMMATNFSNDKVLPFPRNASRDRKNAVVVSKIDMFNAKDSLSDILGGRNKVENCEIAESLECIVFDVSLKTAEEIIGNEEEYMRKGINVIPVTDVVPRLAALEGGNDRKFGDQARRGGGGNRRGNARGTSNSARGSRDSSRGSSGSQKSTGFQEYKKLHRRG